MKRGNIVILIIIVVLVAIGIYFSIEPSPESRRGKKKIAKIEAEARADSIETVEKRKADSIRKITEAKRRAEEAYRNRPWKLDQFVDEFGDPAGKFIKFTTTGVFSNSATSGSPLYVKIYVTKTNVGIMLSEYEPTDPPQKPIGTWTVRMKSESDQILSVTTNREWNQSGGLLIPNLYYHSEYIKDTYDASRIINFFKKSVGEIRVVIRDEYSSTYNFNVDVTGFTEDFSQL